LLGQAGNPVQTTRAVLASGYLSGRLRHNRRRRCDLDADADISPEQRQLAGVLDAARGAHYRLAVPALGPETPSTERFFAEQRLAHGLARPHGRPPSRSPASRISLFAPRRA